MLKAIPNLQMDVVLAPLTTYNIGGPADYFVVVNDKQSLSHAIIEARKAGVPYFVLGAGANILIGDKGFRGLVIKNEARGVQIVGNTVVAESGALVSDVIEVTAKHSLSGFEHFAGIPSTMGGAVWQNLHFLSPNRERTVYLSDIFDSAEVLDENNEILVCGKLFFEFDYDFSVLHRRPLVVLEVTCTGSFLSEELIRDQVERNLLWRKEKQPSYEEFPSCGSVFKKIEGVGAGRLIEKVGLKGHQIGNVQISEKHANFFVNMGGATAKDVRELIVTAQETVLKKTGYKLETEISFIGEF